MDVPLSGERLEIKKYANRRFYDISRSRHITLADMYELIRGGRELHIQDSTTGEDITNLVLTQIILERDPPKLQLFPSNILHQVIRTQQQMLGGVFEQFFRQMIEAQRSSQQQWTRFLQNTLGGQVAASPFDWTRTLLEAFALPMSPEANSPEGSRSPGPDQAPQDRELQELRTQMAEIIKRVEQLSREPSRRSSSHRDPGKSK